MGDKDLYSGLIRLHPASRGRGADLRPGHHRGAWPARVQLSAGTIYPILHGMGAKGYLRSSEKRFGRTVRRFYRATAKGRKALANAKEGPELFGELFERQ